MNGHGQALLRAQELHLSCDIKCSKASLVLGMSGTAGLASSQKFILQNSAVTRIPTTRGQRSSLQPAVTGESASWHGPSCCWALFEHLKSTNDTMKSLLVLGPMPWVSSVCKEDLQQQCQHTRELRAGRTLQLSSVGCTGVPSWQNRMSLSWSLYWCSN